MQVDHATTQLSTSQDRRGVRDVRLFKFIASFTTSYITAPVSMSSEGGMTVGKTLTKAAESFRGACAELGLDIALISDRSDAAASRGSSNRFAATAGGSGGRGRAPLFMEGLTASRGGGGGGGGASASALASRTRAAIGAARGEWQCHRENFGHGAQ
jgi:hypothetical protein